MNRLRLRAERSAKDFYNRRQNEPVEALIGDGAGNVDVSGRLNWVWVRVRGDAYRVAVAYNASGRLFAEGDSVSLLWQKRTGIGYYAITGYSGAVSYDIYGAGSGDETGTGVKAHAWQHERRDQGAGGPDPLDLYPRMDVPLRARPQTTPDMTLYVEAGYNQLTGNLWPGGNSAAFNVAALTSGQSRIDLLYMDGADALQIANGVAASGWAVPTAPALVSPSVPLAYVYLIYGQTSITESSIYKDARLTVGAIGFGTGSGHIIQDEGVDKAAEAHLNFVGAGVTVTDDAGNTATVVTIPGGTGNHDLLDGSVDQDTTASTVTRGDLIVGNATPKWDDLAIGTARQLLAVNAGGTDPEWASFDWDNAGAAAGADMVHDHSAAGEGNKLAQANTHESPDTDAAVGSLHHTIDPTGASAVKAAAANHSHGVGGAIPSHAYFTELAAMLEPLAIEVPQKSTFTYVIAAGVTKYLLLGWDLDIGATTAHALEIRDPRFPLPLNGVTVKGSEAASVAAFLDPTLPTYTDAWTTYYDRLETIATAQTKYLKATAASTAYPLLIPPYGIIITQVTSFNFVWLALRRSFDHTNAWALDYELGDTGASDYMRFAHQMTLPVTKEMADGIVTGQAGGVGTAAGSITYILCPSTWGAVTDPNTYDFRDDFMGASLDTASAWTRTQTGIGQIEIDTTWQWLKCVGDGTWGHNGAHSQGSIARATGKVFLCDVFIDPTATGTGGSPHIPNIVVGFHDGVGQSYTDFAHGLHFTTSAGDFALNVWEDGNNRGVVGSKYSAGYIYRVRMTLQATSTQAKYEIQGGPEYGQLGSSTWTDITPGTTSSSTDPLYAGVTTQGEVANSKYADVSDVRMY